MSSAPHETPIGALLQTVFTSILEVFLLCLAGYILAGQGILDKKTQKQINRLNVSLFTPSLLFSKVAFFLSPAKFRELWIIPIFFVLVTSVSMAVAFALGWVFGLRRSQRSFAMAAAMFMNTNSLPIALMQSLVVTVPGMMWGDGDNKDAMVGRALTYLVLFSTLGMLLRWSYGVRLLTRTDSESDIALTSAEIDENRPLLSSLDEDQHGPSSTIAPDADTYNIMVEEPSPISDTSEDNPEPHILPRRRTTFYNSFPNSPNQSRTNLSHIHSAPSSSTVSTYVASDSDSEAENDDALPIHSHPRRHRIPASTAPPSAFCLFFRRSSQRTIRPLKVLNSFMTVPLWASLASLVVACIQPLQHVLEYHMQPVKGAIASAGQCSIPLTLVVLGAYFYPPPEEAGEDGRGKALDGTQKKSPSLVKRIRTMFSFKKTRRDQGPKNKGRPGETKAVVIAVASRMIITPLFLVPLIGLSTKFDLHAIFEDPVFVVVSVLLISSPPALTLAQISQAASGDTFERLISRTIFWSYCVVTPPTIIFYIVVGLILSKW